MKVDFNNGFTLAETLIVVAIIGIVAAMTLPALIQNYQEMVLKIQFKKVYSLISKALLKAEADLEYKPDCYYWIQSPYNSAICLEYSDNGACKKNGLPDGSPLPSDYNGPYSQCAQLKNAMYNNLKVTKKCDSQALANGCIPKYKGLDDIYRDNHAEASDNDVNKATSGCQKWKTAALHNDREVWNLYNGSSIIFFSSDSFKIFAVDINGHKGPNKWGYDVFSFTVKSDGKNPLKLYGGGCMAVEKGGVTTPIMIKNVN